jgi:hypothetical protein
MATAPKLLTDEQLYQMTGSWEAAAAARDQQNRAANVYNDAQNLIKALGGAPPTQASAIAGVVDPTQVGQYVQDPNTGKYVALSAYSAGFDPNNPITQTYLGELASRGGQDTTSQVFSQLGGNQAQKDANAAAYAIELARLQEIDRQNALNATQGQPQGLLDTGKTATSGQVAKTYSPFETAAYTAYKSGDIAGVNRAVQEGKLTKAQVQSSFGLSDADMNWMANNAGVKFFTPTADTIVTGGTGGTVVGNKTYTADETALYNAYRSGDIATVNRLLAANKWTGADIKSKFGLTDADISWITNNAGGKFYSPIGTGTGTGTGVGVGTGVGGQTPTGQFRELFPSFAESKRLAGQMVAGRPTTEQIVSMINSNAARPVTVGGVNYSAPESAAFNAYRSGNMPEFNRLTQLNQLTAPNMQAKFGLTDADMSWITNNAGGVFYNPTGTQQAAPTSLNNVLSMISK